MIPYFATINDKFSRTEFSLLIPIVEKKMEMLTFQSLSRTWPPISGFRYVTLDIFTRFFIMADDDNGGPVFNLQPS